ncbi:MAG: hypothetical protein K0S56_2405 [Microvirga sp.]|jgi:hypothetical protein|nr:hypothetical protein [Microvirga sp.]
MAILALLSRRLRTVPTSQRLIAQAGIIQHRPFQRRAGRQALDFVRESYLEGAVAGDDRRLTTDVHTKALVVTQLHTLFVSRNALCEAAPSPSLGRVLRGEKPMKTALAEKVRSAVRGIGAEDRSGSVGA